MDDETAQEDIKVIHTFNNAWKLEFEGIQFTVAIPGHEKWCVKALSINWMSDWAVVRDWVNRGLIKEEFIPNSMCDAYQLWMGKVPA